MWPNEKVAVGVAIDENYLSSNTIELRQVEIWEEKNDRSNELPVIRAEISRIDFKTLQIVVDKRRMSEMQAQIYFGSNYILVKHEIAIPEGIRSALGLPYSSFLIPKSFLICRDRNFFHHFLECRMLRKENREIAKSV
jgi:hypothetical protein